MYLPLYYVGVVCVFRLFMVECPPSPYIYNKNETDNIARAKGNIYMATGSRPPELAVLNCQPKY